MDAELKAKWAEALRSGNYKQCYGQLKDGDKFCCLGVLADICGLAITRDGLRITGEDRDKGYHTIFDLIGGEETGKLLWRMNDGGASFSKIADHIEKAL